jgi:hypothetical protein
MGVLMVETLGKHWTLYLLYRAFVGFSDVDIEDTKISSATFPMFSFPTLIELLNEVPRLRLTVASRIYYKSFYHFILLTS